MTLVISALKHVLGALKTNPLLVLLFVLAGYAGLATVRARTLTRERDYARLAVTNAQAYAVEMEQVAAGVYSRLAVQEGLTRTATDRAARLERALAEARVRVRIDTVRVQAESVVREDTSGVRRASFDVYTEPVRVQSDVELPAPPGLGWIRHSVVIDPAPLTVRVGCRRAPPPSADEALVTLEGPEWLRVDLATPTLDPRLCNPGLSQVPGSGKVTRWWFPVVGALAGAASSAVFGEGIWKGAAVGGGVGLGVLLVF